MFAFRNHFSRIFMLGAVFTLTHFAFGEMEFVITSHQPNGIHVVDENGDVVWTHAAIRHPQDFDLDAEGNIFCSEVPGAKLISPDHKVLWEYKVPEGCQNPVAQVLGDGRYLVGHEGPAQLLEINASGVVLKTVQLDSKNSKSHGQFRFCRKTPQGTYLVPLTAEKLVKEYAADGSVVQDFGKFTAPVSALRLKNGNTLIGSLRKLSEFNPDGELIWEFNPVEDGQLGEGAKGHVTGLVELDNGDIAFGFYHKEELWPDIMVVNRKIGVVHSIVLPEINKAAGLRVRSERVL